jgi:hypothetical protein
MNRWVSRTILILALLSVCLVSLGLPRIVLAVALVCAWLALSTVLSFAGDRRYVRAVGDVVTNQPSIGAHAPSRLSIGQVVLVGELVVNLPVIALLVGVIGTVGSLLQRAVGYNGVGHAPALPTVIAVVLAFIASWLWWSFATPRWLLWAMRRVADPIALKRAATGSILWSDQQWGGFFNSTQWRSAAMKDEERDIIHRFTKYKNEN